VAVQADEATRGIAPPWTRQGQQDLTAWYEAVFRGSPVQYLEQLGVWAVFPYADVEAVLRDDVNWSARRRLEKVDPRLRPYRLSTDTLTGSDPPDHTRLRRLVTPGFRPSLVKALRDRAEEISVRLLDDALVRGSFDFVGDYARRLSTSMIAVMLGIPGPLRDQFDDLMHRIEATVVSHNAQGDGETDGATFVGSVGPDTDVELLVRLGEAHVQEWRELIDPLLEQRRREPCEDMLTAFVQAEEEDGRLSDRELHQMTLLLNFAGSSTTEALMTNTVIELSRAPAQWDELRRRRELVTPAIEEVLRFRSPIGAVSRMSNGDVELRGVTVPADEILLVFVQGANRDPSVFAAPNRFDIERPNAHRHVSFASGIHFCVGAHLARMECDVFLRHWLERVDCWSVDDAELDFPGRSVTSVNASSLAVTVTGR
jgi:cytochrome P450